MFTFGFRFSSLLIVLTCTIFLSPLSAKEIDAESALEDFIHYTLVANVEDAKTYAKLLIRDDMSDVEFYVLIKNTYM